MEGFFFSPILLCSQTSYDPQEGLVKFDYGPNMKVEKFKNPIIFWLFSGTCCRNLAILFLIFECGKSGASSKQKSFICVKIWNHFLQVEKIWKLAPKNNTGKVLPHFWPIRRNFHEKLARICQIFTKIFQIPRVLW